MDKVDFEQILRHLGRITFDKLDYLILTIAAVAYIILMFHLSYIKYYTFQDTFYDLGLNNEILWLLSHGFVSNYFGSQFYQIYPLQFEKPIIFLLVPFYSIYPHPENLLFLQSFVLGITVYPIYKASRNLIESKIISEIFAISFLFFFPIASVNLFDFHFTSLFPLFYLTTVMFWSGRKTKLMILFALLTATVNPLALILIVFFLLYVIANNYRNKGNISLSSFTRSNIILLATTCGLIFVFGLYHILGTLYLSGASATVGSNVILFDINAKLELFLFLFGSLAFIPLFEPITLLFISPYAGYAILSTDGSNFQIFGLHYPLFAAGPLYLGLLLGFKGIINSFHSQNGIERRKVNLKQLLSYRKRNSTVIKVMTAFVVAVAVFSTVYFPYSPVNRDVQGGYFNGNHDYTGITNVTSEVLSLHKIISTIPANASVLTLNDLPQASGREYVALYDNHANVQYNYILYNSYFHYYTFPRDYVNFLNNAISNQSYGIFAEGPNSLLLKRNYTMPPKLYIPLNTNISASNLTPFGNAKRVGGAIVDNYSDLFMWYGPYRTMLPGTYNFTFYLSSGNVSSNASQAINIEISSGSTVFSTMVISRNAFHSSGSLVGFTLSATFKLVTPYVEFRGYLNDGSARIAIHSVRIQQTST